MIARYGMYRKLTAFAPLRQAQNNGNFVTSSNNLATGLTLTNATAVSCTSNTQTFIATANSGRIQGGYIDVGHRVFFCALVKTASNAVAMQWYNNDTTQMITFAHPGDGQYHSLYILTTRSSGGAWSYVRIYDGRSSGWDNISVQNFVLIDMGTDATNPFYNKSAAEMLTIAQSGYWEGYKNQPF